MDKVLFYIVPAFITDDNVLSDNMNQNFELPPSLLIYLQCASVTLVVLCRSCVTRSKVIVHVVQR